MIDIVINYYSELHPLDAIAQIMVPVCSITALIFMSYAESAKMRMYGGMAGLASEPFWFITTWMNEQYTIVFLCFIYGVSWFLVFRNNRRVYLREKEHAQIRQSLR